MSMIEWVFVYATLFYVLATCWLSFKFAQAFLAVFFPRTVSPHARP